MNGSSAPCLRCTLCLACSCWAFAFWPASFLDRFWRGGCRPIENNEKQYVHQDLEVQATTHTVSDLEADKLYYYSVQATDGTLTSAESSMVVVLPLVTVAYGFFLSFSVCCFTAAFGADGVLLALAVFGLRCAVTVPCYFLLAVPSWGTSAALASVSFGRGRRCAPVTYDRGCWLRLGLSAAALLGMMLERIL